MTLPFVQLNDAAFDLDPTEFKALAALHRFADLFGRCWPGQRRLALVARMTIGTLNRALKKLRIRGAITIDCRGGSKSNVYQIADGYRVARCSTVGTKGIAKKDSESVDKSESLNAARAKGKEEKTDTNPEDGRDAPFAGIKVEHRPGTPFAPLSRNTAPRRWRPPSSPALRKKRRDLLVQKLARFLTARRRFEGLAAYWAAMLGDDPAAAQRMLDETDHRMRSERWDDMREWKIQSGIAP
jgi:hypothetical protein